MNTADTVLAAHRACSPRATLLVDVNREFAVALALEEGVVALTKTGKKPEEMWALAGKETIQLAVISVKRSSRELYRVLSLAERLVAVGGSILVAPEAVNTAAIDAFCHVYKMAQRCDGILRIFKPAMHEQVAKVEKRAETSSKRVISLAIFGEDQSYWNALPLYIRAHHALFPGYELRIHHDDLIYRQPYGDVLHGLQRRRLVNLVYMPSKPTDGICKKMLWRLAPCWDPEVGYVFCRDIDALPTWRERMVAEEFIESGLPFGNQRSAV